MVPLGRLSRTAFLLAALGLAGSLEAQTISDFSPRNAAVGSEITINGSDLGPSKQKVQLFDAVTGKKYSLKVSFFSATQIRATISKAVVGDLELRVTVKGVPDPVIAPGTLSIEAPLVTSLSTTEAGPDALFSVFGDFFGIKKGKLLVFGVKAKIVSWTMNEIQVRMPKKLANGLWPIVVSNKLGIDQGATIKMVGSTAKVGKAGINITIDGNTVKFKYSAGVQAPGIIAAGGATGTNPGKVLAIAVPYNFLNLEPPFTVDENSFQFGFIYTEIPKITSFTDATNPAKQPSVWLPTPGYSFTLTVNAESGGQIGATYSGTLKKLSGLNGPDTIFVEGSVIVDV